MYYKLKKRYPSLPNDWEVGMEIGLGDRPNVFNGYSPCSSKYMEHRIHYREVCSSEFWEKVVPKEFEVVKKQRFPLQGVPGNYYNVIESVKRLRTGEVFSVGDKVVFYQKRARIKSIYFNEHNQLSFQVEGDTAPLTGVFSEKMHLIKLKQEDVLLVTEDGFEIFEGDEYYSIFINDLTFQGTFKAETPNNGKFTNPNSCKTFSTKEAAQAYIENNSRLFSAKDVHELLKKYSRMMVDSSVYLELSKMVKERLKNE